MLIENMYTYCVVISWRIYMPLFLRNSNKLVRISEKPFRIEKESQTLLESNLPQVLGLTFVRSEFSVKNRRIDSLAFDEQKKSFVILEFKRDKSSSVVDQGAAYLGLILNNRADFILEINEILGRKYKRDNIDWSQTRVILVAAKFSDIQKEAVDSDILGVGIELLDVHQYENKLYSFDFIRKTKNLGNKKIKKHSKFNKIVKELKEYTEEQHLEKASDKMFSLYEELKSTILNIDSSIEVVPLKKYISFKSGSSLCAVVVYKQHLTLALNAKWGSLDDSKKLFRNVSDIGHWGGGEYMLKITDSKNLEYIASVIKQMI